MTTQIPLIPETAPFTSAQRAWLNGFFAGLLGLGGHSGEQPGGDPSGPSSALAAPASPPRPLDSEESFPWHDATLPLDERLRLAAGKPVERVLMAAMAQLDCGACGYLCKTYSEAIARGEEKSLTLCAPGGRATAATLKEILARLDAAPGTGPAARSADHAQAPLAKTPPTDGSRHPFAARMVRCVRLNHHGSAKDTRLVVLDLEGSGLAYEPGDSLGVYAENCPELVGEILRALKAKGNEAVDVPGGAQAPLYEALLRHVSIRTPTDDLLELLGAAGSVPDPAADERDVIDVLEESPHARPSPSAFARALAPLQPRLYSISSSLRAHPDEVHLTVSVVRYEARGKIRKGVASTYLAELKPGQRVRVFLRPSHGFKLPANDQAPIVMIGPGTGVAPFRAFLEERKARGARGRAWLFFGEQRRELDFLYRQELEDYRRDGFLTRLDTAFSRDQADKVYVQHRMLESARELWSWIQEGATIYVCGDAKRMAKDVDAALKRITSIEGRMTATEASEYVARLAKDHRYLRDVY